MAEAAGLAGRVRELREVTQVLTGSCEHRAMLVIGDAGVGKSRLVAAAAASVAPDVLILSSWCLPLSHTVPFLAIVNVLREVDEAADDRLLAALLDNCPAFVGDEVFRLIPGGEDAPVDGAGASDGWGKQRQFDALRLLFAALGKARPTGLVIEDVHWADPSTLELIDYLLTSARATDVPMVLTCRSEEASSTALVGWLERLQRNPRVHRLDLTPLTEAETAEQIGLLLDQQPPRTFVAEIYRRSEGNAFFTEQLVASGHDREPPTGLMSLLLSRTAQVPGVGHELLAALAVGERPFDEASLVGLSQRSVSEVRDALRDLIGRRLIRHPDHAGRYQLRHALLAEAISHELLHSERVELHIRIAELMADWNDTSVAAEIATHLAAAGRDSDELVWRVRAARRADAVFASKEAAEHWERGITLTADAPPTLVVEGMSLAELYGAAEDALAFSGNEEAAFALAEDALLRLAEADPVSRADVLRRAGDARGVANAERGLELLYQALELHERLPPTADHVDTLRGVAALLAGAGRLTDAAEIAAKATALAERTGWQVARHDVLAEQAYFEFAAGDGELALERIRTLREQLTEQDAPATQLLLARFHTSMLFNLGRLTEVEAAAASALQLAAVHGIERSFFAVVLRARVFTALIELGSVDAAARLIEPFCEGQPRLSTWLDFDAGAALDMYHGDLERASQRWLPIEMIPEQTLTLRVSPGIRQAENDLWRNAPESSLARCRTLLIRAADVHGPDLCGPLLILGLRATADLAQQARADQDDTALTTAIEQAQELLHMHDELHADPFTPGPLRPTADAEGAVWQAEWSRLKGEPDPGLWEQAAVAWDGLPRPHRSAYARWRQGEALLAQPNGRAAAVEILRIALRQAAQHVPLSNAITGLARRARINLSDLKEPTSHRPAKPQKFGFTDRELAVLQLLGEGKTNAEIGTALFISTKTASVHVTNILRKLEVSTRVQAATVAERAGLLTPGTR
jgi:DNA-binding CsgD family transcriptional regulator